MKIYPIFLASSFELQPERKEFELFVGRQNKRLIKKNVQLQLEIWEDMGAELNNGRKQDDYNKKLQIAEIVVVLFWTKVGKYTHEEFDLAHQRFLETGRPLIYVYQKTAIPPNEPLDRERKSKASFIQQLLMPGKEQFSVSFANSSEIIAHFQQTLLDLFDGNKLTFGVVAARHSLKAPMRPSFFIGRKNELEDITEKFRNKGTVIILSGEGGMGKTTLACKYWYESQYVYSHCAYLFCEGGIIQAMIADGMGLDLAGLSVELSIVKLQRRLAEFGADFLLLLDNVDDVTDIREFFKDFGSLSGNLLITTRCREVNDADMEIFLDHLAPEEAKALFKKYYEEEGDGFDRTLDRFLEGIHYHTLLTEVFAKNLKEASELGVNLTIFLESVEKDGLFLNENNNFDIITDYGDKLETRTAYTNDILGILYDFGKLSEEERVILVNLSLVPPTSHTLDSLIELFQPENSRSFRDILKSLHRNGWIGGIDREYRLSPVIQKMVHHKNRETLSEDAKKYIAMLMNLISYEEDKDNAHSRFKWLPYGRHLANVFHKSRDPDFALFLNHLGILLLQLGGRENLLQAKEHLETGLDLNLNKFGEDAPEVANTRSNLALVLRDLGGKSNLFEAKFQLERALDLYLSKLAKDLPELAVCRSNLAAVLQFLGGRENLMKAKLLLQKALASDLGNFGKDSYAVAVTRSNLATILEDLGGKANLLKAKGLLEKALESDLKNFNENSPKVTIRRSNLAAVLQSLGGKRNLLEAKRLLENALASDLIHFGKYTPAATTSRSNLALVLGDLGGDMNLREARKHLEIALHSDLVNFGEDSINVALSSYNLTTILIKMGCGSDILQIKKHLESSKSIYLHHFEDHPMLENIQGRLNGITKLLEAMVMMKLDGY